MKGTLRKGGALVGTLLAGFVGLWLMKPAAGSEAGVRAPRKPASTAARTPKATGTLTGTAAQQAAPLPAAPLPSPESRAAAIQKAHDFIKRLQAAVGPRPGLPADLQRELLDFLREGGEGRDAFCRLLWDPATSRRVVGHLKLVLSGLSDRELAAAIRTAIDSADPENALRVEMAKRSSDPALMVADLRAMAPGKERADRLTQLGKELVARNAAVADFLMETAKEDPDEDTRTVAYNRLAYAGVPGTADLLAGVASDAGKGTRERSLALHALALVPQAPTADALARLYADSPAEARPLVVNLMGRAGASSALDGILVEALAPVEDGLSLRRAAAMAIGLRLSRLPGESTRDLGEQTATTLRGLAPEDAAPILKFFNLGLLKSDALREAVKEMQRRAPAGGPIQVAIANDAGLRMAVAAN